MVIVLNMYYRAGKVTSSDPTIFSLFCLTSKFLVPPRQQFEQVGGYCVTDRVQRKVIEVMAEPDHQTTRNQIGKSPR